MRSDDDGFVSRQVAASQLLRNTSLTFTAYRTEVFDVSKFASVQLQLVPDASADFPLYVTVEWWLDRDRTLLVTTDVISWSALPVNADARRWFGAIPCRADFMSITFDASGTNGNLAMAVIGSSRSVPTITQQVGSRSLAGGPPFALAYSSQVIPAFGTGTYVDVPPWFGDVEINVYTDIASSAFTFLIVRNTAAVNGGTTDSVVIPLDNTGTRPGNLTFSSVGTTTLWNGRRLAVNGQALRLLGSNGTATPGTMVMQVMPVTGR